MSAPFFILEGAWRTAPVEFCLDVCLEVGTGPNETELRGLGLWRGARHDTMFFRDFGESSNYEMFTPKFLFLHNHTMDRIASKNVA
jgi:hypothetical protein